MFVLQIPFTIQALDAIKLNLNYRFRAVKSSHRCEAIARGLGHGTYASARAAAQSSTPSLATADGRAFAVYLAEHGFTVEPSHLYQAVVRTALTGIVERYPRLTMIGIGAGRPQRADDGRHERPTEHFARLQADRERLKGDSAIEPFLVCLALLSRVTRTRTIRPKTNSYWIKHIAENYAATYPEGCALGPRYVPNGVLIAAAIHAGFDIRTHVDELGYDSLNTTFNMSHADLIDLDCEVRPDGARAQNRHHAKERRALHARYRPS